MRLTKSVLIENREYQEEQDRLAELQRQRDKN